MAVHSVFMNYISHNVHLCSFTAMPSAPTIRQTYKSKSSAPFGLRSPDTSHRWSRAVKYAHERCPFAVPRAPAEPIVRHGKCIYKFHITDFMPHRLRVNHVRREDALQQQTMFLPQAEIKTQHELFFFFFSDVNFTSQKRCISQLAVALRKSKSNTRQTNGQINHPYWISSSCCDYLHVLFFFVLCRRFCVTPWGSIASNDRALWVDLGCIRSAMEKIPPTLPVSHSANTCLHNSK